MRMTNNGRYFVQSPIAVHSGSTQPDALCRCWRLHGQLVQLPAGQCRAVTEMQ